MNDYELAMTAATFHGIKRNYKWIKIQRVVKKNNVIVGKNPAG